MARVGQGVFVVEVADDSAERAVGLSGRDSLPRGGGMWFAYFNVHQPSFWMRGMRFALDIVWIDSSLHVVDVTHDAPAPPGDSALEDLPLYTPNAPIKYVLEINAGLARDLRIERGALVTISDFE